MDSLRAEVAGHGIHVSVISPGYVRTNISVNALTSDGSAYGSEYLEYTRKNMPLFFYCCNRDGYTAEICVQI